jgi:hypothetical protein
MSDANDYGISRTCLPVIRKRESFSIEIIFPMSSLSTIRTLSSTSLSQLWITSGMYYAILISYIRSSDIRRRTYNLGSQTQGDENSVSVASALEQEEDKSSKGYGPPFP